MMALSCECNFDDDCDWYWESPEYYSEYRKLRATKCCACKKRIKYGDLITVIYRTRPSTEWEEWNLNFEEVYIANHYACEKCSDMYFSLEDLGFCADPYMPWSEAVKEYREYVAIKTNKASE
jgi:hypothetical protein